MPKPVNYIIDGKRYTAQSYDECSHKDIAALMFKVHLYCGDNDDAINYLTHMVKIGAIPGYKVSLLPEETQLQLSSIVGSFLLQRPKRGIESINIACKALDDIMGIDPSDPRYCEVMRINDYLKDSAKYMKGYHLTPFELSESMTVVLREVEILLQDAERLCGYAQTTVYLKSGDVFNTQNDDLLHHLKKLNAILKRSNSSSKWGSMPAGPRLLAVSNPDFDQFVFTLSHNNKGEYVLQQFDSRDSRQLAKEYSMANSSRARFLTRIELFSQAESAATGLAGARSGSSANDVREVQPARSRGFRN